MEEQVLAKHKVMGSTPLQWHHFGEVMKLVDMLHSRIRRMKRRRNVAVIIDFIDCYFVRSIRTSPTNLLLLSYIC
jgi:hypothetical protein